MNLQDSAMLVSLTISQWTNRKHDKKISQEVEANHAARDAGRYNKQLVEKSALLPIGQVASRARDYHYKMTLPWGDNGDRMLPATLFMDYTAEMRNLKSDFASRVAEFVRVYPTLVQNARVRLGSMYEPGDYPDPSDIKSRFGIETAITPVPTAGDFRVNLNEDYVAAIKSDITAQMDERLRAAIRHCWTRVRDVVEHIHERLSDKDLVFRDSLIENARELVAVLPGLNIMNDPQLNAMGEEIKTLLVHPDRLRKDEGVRSDTAERAAAILAKLPKFG